MGRYYPPLLSSRTMVYKFGAFNDVLVKSLTDLEHGRDLADDLV